MVRESFKNGAWWKVPLLTALLAVMVGMVAYVWTDKDLDTIRLESRIEKLDKNKVDKCLYDNQMQRVEADIGEIKSDMKAQRRTLEQIRIMIAENNQ